MQWMLVALNLAGLGLYVWWLGGKGGKLTHSSEGILLLLPVLPFLFVLSALLRSGETGDARPDEPAGKDEP